MRLQVRRIDHLGGYRSEVRGRAPLSVVAGVPEMCRRARLLVVAGAGPALIAIACAITVAVPEGEVEGGEVEGEDDLGC